jgi:hypothetical protein
MFTPGMARWRSLRRLLVLYSLAAQHERRAIDRQHALEALQEVRQLLRELLRGGVVRERVSLPPSRAA